MTTVHVVGTGYLGTRLTDGLAAVPRPYKLRLLNARRVADEPAPERGDVVINAVGETGRPNIDWCEEHQHETYEANVACALDLAQACARSDLYMIHLSSGCCFYGEGPGYGGAWREDDHANPESFYSRTKYAADLVLSRLPNVAVVRLRMPIDATPHPKNLITKLASYERVIDVCNSVTVLDDFVRVIAGLIEQRATGVFHAVNPGGLWHRSLLDLYCGYVDPDHKVQYIPPSDLPTKAPRSTCVLADTRLPALGLGMRPIGEALPEVMKRYARLYRSPPDALAAT